MSDFWNGILRQHADAQIKATKAVTLAATDHHRGWAVTWDYGFYTATGPNYDASWEGEEDGWVDNGHRVTARTREALIEEVDAWFEEQGL